MSQSLTNDFPMILPETRSPNRNMRNGRWPKSIGLGRPFRVARRKSFRVKRREEFFDGIFLDSLW